jgi:gamma-glutamyl-gamma-aminobutyrate hydrolase PuuD
MTDNILVVQGASYSRAIDELGVITARVSRFMENPKKFKLVLFTGGADIDPRFYGDSSPKGLCVSNPTRDIFEIAVFKKALENNILMTGICRGLQFLNVMSGGKLIHHLDGHEGVYHNVATSTGERIRTNSLHHQMIIPPENSITTAWCDPSLSKTYIGQGDEPLVGKMAECESAIFPATKSFGVQYHPEIMHKDSTGYMWYLSMTKRALEMNWEDFVEYYRKPNNDKSLEVC